MTLDEAELFYKKYNGNSFHMYREETSLYIEFTKLNLSSEIINEWNREIVIFLFNNLWNNREKVCFSLSRVFEVIIKDRENLNKNIQSFLFEVKKCTQLDYKQRIIIIEDFAGRDSSLKNGFCYFICKNTNYKDEMNEIVIKLMDFHCIGNEELEERLEKAKIRYKSAFDKFSKIVERKPYRKKS